MQAQTISVLYQEDSFDVEYSKLHDSSNKFREMIKPFLDTGADLQKLQLRILYDKFTSRNVRNFLKMVQNQRNDVHSNEIPQICELSKLFQVEKLYDKSMTYLKRTNPNYSVSNDFNESNGQKFLKVEYVKEPLTSTNNLGSNSTSTFTTNNINTISTNTANASSINSNAVPSPNEPKPSSISPSTFDTRNIDTNSTNIDSINSLNSSTSSKPNSISPSTFNTSSIDTDTTNTTNNFNTSSLNSSAPIATNTPPSASNPPSSPNSSIINTNTPNIQSSNPNSNTIRANNTVSIDSLASLSSQSSTLGTYPTLATSKSQANFKPVQVQPKATVYKVQVFNPLMKCCRFFFSREGRILYTGKQKSKEIFIGYGNVVHIRTKEESCGRILQCDGYNMVTTKDQEFKVSYVQRGGKKQFSLETSFLNGGKNFFWSPQEAESDLGGQFGRSPMQSKRNTALKNEEGKQACIVRKMEDDMFEIECLSSVNPLIVFIVGLSQIVGPI